ncbi:integrase catalytic domain-containing protein [Trichonephila clavipes]|uniref:Integrase catalytic domain-containing protein n=1 Tax=Trichonephila clavipes TaxID=2585209 RepID=A0A8X7BAS1_TRICX|nr:integrase catalytic domain-containing protein [Trichonephila clavipes]
MTLEEFLTIITQIEGILNSRPITPLSEDIDDFEILTPGHFLIQRNKWQFHKDNVKLNTMVLIKDDNLPVNKWSLGRITKLVPGTDGKVRVVEIKTNKGKIKRSIGKVCVLPLDN